jgi:hypothetical protein
MNVIISVLLLFVIAISLINCIYYTEPYYQSEPPKVCKISTDKTYCTLGVAEEEATMRKDAKCHPAAVSYESRGLYARSGKPFLDNGRFRKFKESEDTCEFNLSDDLVRYNKSVDCSKMNKNLYSEVHGDVVDTISQDEGTGRCTIKFKSDWDKNLGKVRDYSEFLTLQASRTMSS